MLGVPILGRLAGHAVDAHEIPNFAELRHQLPKPAGIVIEMPSADHQRKQGRSVWRSEHDEPGVRVGSPQPMPIVRQLRIVDVERAVLAIPKVLEISQDRALPTVLAHGLTQVADVAPIVMVHGAYVATHPERPIENAKGFTKQVQA